MANHKAGNVGDVFKHLILAEVLGEVRASGAPSSYWDIYAGAATYQLTPSRERSYGVCRFAESESLPSSAYRELLDQFSGTGVFPGSPAIALSMLSNSSFRFVDRRPDSLQTVREFAVDRGVPKENLQVHEGEALLKLRAFLGADEADLTATVVLIDPFNPLEGAPGLRPVDEFMRCAERGTKALLWYPVTDKCESGAMRNELERLASTFAVDGLSFAELVLDAGREPRQTVDPKLHGCGFAFGNLEAVALLDRMRLRDATERELYPRSTLTYGELSNSRVAGAAPPLEREQV